MKRLTEIIKEAGSTVKSEVKIYRSVLKDKDTPAVAKFLLGIAIAYALSPIDLIPDFIPVLGYLDDALILPALFFIALRFIPKEIVARHRKALSKKE